MTVIDRSAELHTTIYGEQVYSFKQNVKNYPANSTAVDNWNVDRGKRLSAALGSLPVLFFLPTVVARIASNEERWCVDGGPIASPSCRQRPRCCDAVFSVEVVPVVVRVLTAVTESTGAASRRINSRAKVYKNTTDNIIIIYQTINVLIVGVRSKEVLCSPCLSVCLFVCRVVQRGGKRGKLPRAPQFRRGPRSLKMFFFCQGAP